MQYGQVSILKAGPRVTSVVLRKYEHLVLLLKVLVAPVAYLVLIVDSVAVTVCHKLSHTLLASAALSKPIW